MSPFPGAVLKPSSFGVGFPCKSTCIAPSQNQHPRGVQLYASFEYASGSSVSDFNPREAAAFLHSSQLPIPALASHDDPAANFSYHWYGHEPMPPLKVAAVRAPRAAEGLEALVGVRVAFRCLGSSSPCSGTRVDVRIPFRNTGDRPHRRSTRCQPGSKGRPPHPSSRTRWCTRSACTPRKPSTGPPACPRTRGARAAREGHGEVRDLQRFRFDGVPLVSRARAHDRRALAVDGTQTEVGAAVGLDRRRRQPSQAE